MEDNIENTAAARSLIEMQRLTSGTELGAVAPASGTLGAAGESETEW